MDSITLSIRARTGGTESSISAICCLLSHTGHCLVTTDTGVRDELFKLITPRGHHSSSVIRHGEEISLASVVDLPGLNQCSQCLVDQTNEVLGDGNLAVVCVEPHHDVLHVGLGVGQLQSGQNHAERVLQRGTGTLRNKTVIARLIQYIVVGGQAGVLCNQLALSESK